MEMSESREIAAPPEIVWAAILDPEVLKASLPGCKELSGDPENGYEAVVTQKVGPVKATFNGQVEISDMVEPESLHLSGAGKGGAAGFAKGGATVRLEAIETGTRLHYEVEAKVGGKLAQLGGRVVDGFARKMADQFFANLQAAVEGPTDAEEAPEVETEDGEKRKGWFRRMVSGGGDAA